MSMTELNAIRARLEARVADYVNALSTNDMNAINSIEAAMKQDEKEYAEEAKCIAFSACKSFENPVLEAVKMHDYRILTHRIVREDGVPVGVEIVEKNKDVDLVKFCAYIGISHLWEYKVEKLGNLLCIRTAKELGYTDAQIKGLDRMYYCTALAKKEELGAIPTSNKQIVKLLQEVIDSILYVPNDKGTGNMYRVNSHDVAYMLDCYTGRDNKNRNTVKVAKTSFVHSILLDVMNRITTGTMYGVSFKKFTEEKAEAIEKKVAKLKDEEKKAQAEKYDRADEDARMDDAEVSESSENAESVATEVISRDEMTPAATEAAE